MFVLLANHKNFRDLKSVKQSCHCLEIILEGVLKIGANQAIEKVTTNEMHFRKAGVYTTSTSENYRSLLFFVENHFILDFLNEHIKTYSSVTFPEAPSAFLFNTDEYTNSLAERTTSAIHSQESYASCVIKLLLHQLLLEILAKDKQKQFVSFLRNLISNPAVDLEYLMETHFTRNISIAELASISGRSLSTFKIDFKKIFNTTPGRWLLAKRLEHARLMLLYGQEKRVSEIAYTCGFENAAHFSTKFRMKFGYSPSRLPQAV